jgi:hypothetical protein
MKRISKFLGSLLKKSVADSIATQVDVKAEDLSKGELPKWVFRV